MVFELAELPASNGWLHRRHQFIEAISVIRFSCLNCVYDSWKQFIPFNCLANSHTSRCIFYCLHHPLGMPIELTRVHCSHPSCSNNSPTENVTATIPRNTVGLLSILQTRNTNSNICVANQRNGNKPFVLIPQVMHRFAENLLCESVSIMHGLRHCKLRRYCGGTYCMVRNWDKIHVTTFLQSRRYQMISWLWWPYLIFSLYYELKYYQRSVLIRKIFNSRYHSGLKFVTQSSKPFFLRP